MERYSLKQPADMTTTTAFRAGLNQGISSGTLVDIKIILYSHRDSYGQVHRPKARAIKSVIAMIPFMEKPEGGRPRHHNGRFFFVEKPGLSLAELGVEEGLELPQD